MPDHQDIEAILSRMAPPAISSRGTMRMHQMLDGLSRSQSDFLHHGSPEPTAAVSSPADIQAQPPISRAKALAAVAAAVVLAASAFWPNQANTPAPTVLHDASPEITAPSVWLVSESDRLESVSSDDRTADIDGEAMQAVHLELLEENQWFDEETGIVMHVSAPREEIFLMPISAF